MDQQQGDRILFLNANSVSEAEYIAGQNELKDEVLKDRSSTGPWYAVPATDNIDFGLRPDPEKAVAAGEGGFTFVQITDLHAGQGQADELADLAAVLDLLEGRSATLFCGHLHQSVTLDSEGLPEHITAAVCGEWWGGPNPDGQPQWYRLVSVQRDGVDSLYMGMGDNRTVDFGLSPVVSGPVGRAGCAAGPAPSPMSPAWWTTTRPWPSASRTAGPGSWQLPPGTPLRWPRGTII